MKIELVEEVGSTNDAVKKLLPLREDAVVCANRQTGGRGRNGRAFLSDMGGVYCSFLKFFHDFPAANAFEVMAHAAVSVCRTAAAFGVAPSVKWPNDILWRGRKLCGILIENSFSGGLLDHAVVGIGLNVCNDLTPLRGIAVTLSEAAGRALTVEEVRGALIENFCAESTFGDYLGFVHFLGCTVEVLEGERATVATARRILPDGRLEIEENGVCRALSAAELRLSTKSFMTE